jgi:hypothetical protein
VVFAGWLFKRSSSGSGNGRLVLGRSSSGSGNGRLVLGRSSSGSGNGRLVLATALSYLPAYLPACPCQCLIRFGGGVGPIEGSD